MKKLALLLHEQVSKAMQQYPVILNSSRTFLLEYAKQLANKNGEELYLQALTELLIFKAALSPTPSKLPKSQFLALYFKDSLFVLKKDSSIKKLVDELTVYFTTLFQDYKTGENDLNQYLADGLHLCLVPLGYAKKFFGRRAFTSIHENIILELLTKHDLLASTSLNPFGTPSAFQFFLQKEIQGKLTFYYSQFSPFLIHLLEQRNENVFWINPVKENGFAIPPQMDLFGNNNSVQDKLQAEKISKKNLIISDLRNFSKANIKAFSDTVQKSILSSYAELDFHSVPNNDALLVAFRWCTDCVAKTGSLLLLVDSDMVHRESYTSLRYTIQREFEAIYLAELLDEKETSYVLLLHKKLV